MMTFDQFIKNDEAVRFVFEQARNAAVTGLILAGGLWLWDNESKGTALILFVTTTLFAGLQLFYVIHKVRALKLPRWVKGPLGPVYMLLLTGCITSIAKYHVGVPLNL
jgi:hypothetical protein